MGLRLLKNKCSSNPMTRLVPNQNMELRRKGNAVIVMEDSIVNTKACYARNAHRNRLCRKAGFATEIFSMEREREIPYRSRKGQLPPFLWRIPGERLFQPVFLAGMLAQKHNNIQSINASNKTPCNMKKNERKRSNDLDQRSETKSHEELYESGHVDTYEVRAGDVEVDFRTFEEVWGGYKVS